MKIRLATEDDIPVITELGKLFYSEVPISKYFPYDEESVQTSAKLVIGHSDGFLMVAEGPDGVKGFISGMVTRHYWNLKDPVAQQMAFYIHPDYRGMAGFKLLSAFEAWAVGKGCKLIVSGAKKNHAYATMNKLLKRRGYHEIETVHMKEV